MAKQGKFYIYARRITQSIVFLLIVYILWTLKKPLIGPANPAFFFQFDPFVMLIAATAERILLAGLIYSFITIILTLVFGRAFCGWICPLGSVFDFWDHILSFLKKRRTENEPNKGKNLKYLVLFIIFVFALFGVQIAWTADPITIFVRSFSFVFHPLINSSINNAFETVLKATNFSPFFENIYGNLKGGFLEIRTPYFPHFSLILIEFILLIALVILKRRFWCRYLCPLGGLLSLTAKLAILRRESSSCKEGCSLCRNVCRMNAIKNDGSYIKEECILCMDCISICPDQRSSFIFSKNTPEENLSGSSGLTRTQFLVFLSAVIASIAGFKKSLLGAQAPADKSFVIRPPGSIKENEFDRLCIRCGNCMKACITNVLQPCMFESGLSGIWTPRLMMELSYCEYNCKRCTEVCPTGAIEKLTIENKRKFKIGKANIDKNICVAWSGMSECIVCEEQCPIPDKAIKLEKKQLLSKKIIDVPVVDEKLCIGCGSCQYMCPTSPKRAITIKHL
jgi:MauM/NapG family ferredoxin protein